LYIFLAEPVVHPEPVAEAQPQSNAPSHATEHDDAHAKHAHAVPEPESIDTMALVPAAWLAMNFPALDHTRVEPFESAPIHHEPEADAVTQTQVTDTPSDKAESTPAEPAGEATSETSGRAKQARYSGDMCSVM
jgi:hypothetical protein